ncbi:hypothetical protein LCGC14_1000400 [marine sediment metagenome]|uniref:Uncharacterized protein n=1 Tax=marine sediment metagenome TaxID=412755 RepID=A0A0F9NPQ9_9ZZZZ
MIYSKEEQKFHCDFCGEMESPELPPSWSEYKVECKMPPAGETLPQSIFTKHLCTECRTIVVKLRC